MGQSEKEIEEEEKETEIPGSKKSREQKDLEGKSSQICQLSEQSSQIGNTKSMGCGYSSKRQE